MRETLLAAVAVALFAGHADARTSPPATKIICDDAPAASLVVPVPATKATPNNNRFKVEL
jgi:hypothetical protein